GARVLALARDGRKLEALAGGALDRGRITPVVVDLSLMQDVRRAGAAIAAAGPVDVLVHNVGLMCHEFIRTPEGVERGFAWATGCSTSRCAAAARWARARPSSR
ncbi:hypothetical protein, partial [Arenimonas malthae]|uniref:hypothetical protein n=1 Tax=Arenimonas malthae TaxID=354197 RepID=UPI001B8010D9